MPTKKAAPKAPKVEKVEAPKFAPGPTTVEDAERFTSLLMNYLIKHPAWSISESLERVALPNSATNLERIGKVSELYEGHEIE